MLLKRVLIVEAHALQFHKCDLVLLPFLLPDQVILESSRAPNLRSMNSSASCYILDLAPQKPSPFVRYVYTANGSPAHPAAEVENDQIDPALLEDQRFAAAAEEKISRLSKRPNSHKIGTALGRVSELRIEEGGYAREEAAEEKGEDDAIKTGGRIRAETLDDAFQSSWPADEEPSKVVGSSETSNADNNDSTSAMDINPNSSTTVVDNKNDATAFKSTLCGRKRSHSEEI